jgi:uncharacterized delta-60 repeat protein
VLANGRILAAGGAGENFALARFLSDGTLDPAFGTAGTNYDSPPASSDVTALDLLPDGRIAVAGQATSILGTQRLALGRYSADGIADETFANDGFLLSPYHGVPTALLVRPDGKLIVGGEARTSNTNFGGGTGIARFEQDGTVDNGFGVGGALAGFASFGLDVGGLAPGPDGSVIAAEGVGDDFDLVSYAVDEPSLTAARSAPRACSVNIATKSLAQLLRGGKTARYGKLRLSFFTLQPGRLKLTATAKVGTKTITIGSTTVTNGTYGTGIGEIAVSKSAAKTLRSAKSATITVTATGSSGGGRTATKVLKR